jgi:hypothetical protein
VVVKESEYADIFEEVWPRTELQRGEIQSTSRILVGSTEQKKTLVSSGSSVWLTNVMLLMLFIFLSTVESAAVDGKATQPERAGMSNHHHLHHHITTSTDAGGVQCITKGVADASCFGFLSLSPSPLFTLSLPLSSLALSLSHTHSLFHLLFGPRVEFGQASTCSGAIVVFATYK